MISTYHIASFGRTASPYEDYFAASQAARELVLSEACAVQLARSDLEWKSSGNGCQGKSLVEPHDGLEEEDDSALDDHTVMRQNGKE